MTQVSSLTVSRENRSPLDDILSELWTEGEVGSSSSLDTMDKQTDVLDSLIGGTCNQQVSWFGWLIAAEERTLGSVSCEGVSHTHSVVAGLAHSGVCTIFTVL